MLKPSERDKWTSDNNIIKFKMPVHDPFKRVNGVLEMGVTYIKLLCFFFLAVPGRRKNVFGLTDSMNCSQE